MTAPYVETKELDQSYRVESESGTATAIVIPAKRGPLTAQLITSDTEYLTAYTQDQKVEVGDTLAHFSALAVLEKSNALWVARAVPEDILYGGVVINTVSGASTKLATGLSAPTAYLFKDTEGTATQQKTAISVTANIEGSLAGTYFVLPGQNKYVWFSTGSKPQIGTIVCPQASEFHENEKAQYFTLPGGKYYAWFQVDGRGIDPALEEMTAIKVELSAEETEWVVASKIATAINALEGKFTAVSNSSKVTITNLTAADTEEGNAGTAALVYITVQTASGTGTDPKPTNPMDMTGIEVILTENDSAAKVASLIAAKATGTGITAKYEKGTAEVILINDETGKQAPALEGTSGFDIKTLAYGGKDSGKPCMLIYGANPGEWNNRVVVKIYNYTDHPEKVAVEGAFIIEVFKNTNLNNPVETHLCSLDPAKLDGYGNNLYVEKVLESSNYIAAMVNDAIDPSQMPASDTSGITLTHGDDGSPVTDANMIKTLKAAFSNKDKVKVTLIIDGGWTTAAYHTEMLKLAKARQDCFAILSSPNSAEDSANYKNEIVSYRKDQLNANTSYGAIFTPHLKTFDYFNNRNVWAAPDGQLAGALSAADRDYEIWYPVLGYKRGTLDVLDVKREFTPGDMDYLYANGVNPIRKKTGKGIVIWGQKTLQTAPSALDRINVRMMLIKIEPAIEDTLENFIGEFNTAQTRGDVLSIVGEYLKDIQARNGIRGFKLICDTTNNTPAIINGNKMLLDTYVIPPYSTEYITNTMIITPEGVSLQ